MTILNTYGLTDLNKLKLEDILGNMVLVLGMTGSGKSNTVAVLIEELLMHNIPMVIVDPAGEYYGLKEKFTIWEIGRDKDPNRQIDAEISPTGAYHAATTAYKNAASTILNVSGFHPKGRALFVAEFMETIWNLAPHHRFPYVVVLEEAHNWIPQKGTTAATEVLVQMSTEGRKWGITVLSSSQRSSRLDKDVITQAKLAILHFVRHPADLSVYYEIVPRPRSKVKDSVSRLGVGEALVLHGAEVQRRTIRRRHTPHYGHSPTVDDLPKERGILTAQQFIQPVLPLEMRS